MANIGKLEGINAVVMALTLAIKDLKITAENLEKHPDKYSFGVFHPVIDLSHMSDNTSQPHNRIFSISIKTDKYDSATIAVSPDLKSDAADLNFEICLHDCKLSKDDSGKLLWDETAGYTLSAGLYEPNILFYKKGKRINSVEEGEQYIADLTEEKDKSLSMMFAKRLIEHSSEAELVAAFKYMLSTVNA